MVKIQPLNIESVQYGFYRAITTEGPSVKSFYGASGRVVTRKCLIRGGASCPPYWLANNHAWLRGTHREANQSWPIK